MTSLEYISRFCQTPVEVSIKGVPFLLPCGKCSHCRTQRSRLFSEIIKLHSINKEVHFFTLTYADDTLPLYRVTSDGSISSLTRSDYSILRYKNIRDASLNEKEKYHNYISSLEHKLHVENISLTFKSKSIKENYEKEISDYFSRKGTSSETIPLLTYRDVQLFFKRFRKKINKDFSYVCSCEYGGKNSRPHYHILLFFRSGCGYDTSEFLQILSDTWGKSSSDSYDYKRPNCVSDTLSSYLTDYCTSTSGYLRSSLLNVLDRFNSFRQKTRHSCELLLQIIAENKEFFYRNPRFCYSVGYSLFSDSGKYKKLPASAYRSVCPKPYDFDGSSSIFNKSLFIFRETKDLSNFRLKLFFKHGSKVYVKKIFNSIGIKIFQSTNFNSYDYECCISLAGNTIDSFKELFRLFQERKIGISYSSSLGYIFIPDSLLLFLFEFFKFKKNGEKTIYRLHSELSRFRKSRKYILSEENAFILKGFDLFIDIILKFLSRLIKWNLISRKFLSDVLPYFYNNYSTYLSFIKDFYSFVDLYKLSEFYSFMENSTDPDSFFYNHPSDKSHIISFQEESIYKRSLTKLHNNKHLTF